METKTAIICEHVTVKYWYDQLKDLIIYEFSAPGAEKSVQACMTSENAEKLDFLEDFAADVADSLRENLNVEGNITFIREIVFTVMVNGSKPATGDSWPVYVSSTSYTNGSLTRPSQKFFDTFPCLKKTVGDIVHEHGVGWLPEQLVNWHQLQADTLDKKSINLYESYMPVMLEDLIIKLNDSVKMTREEIADWLDNLHERGIIDLTAQVELDDKYYEMENNDADN